MGDSEDHVGLVKKAQLGDKECLNRLAEVAEVRLHQYVLRLTLEKDMTDDIVQESILEMFKVFEKLKKAEQFWAWLYGIALNKVRRHYGRQWRHRAVSLSQAGHALAEDKRDDAVATMVGRELKEIILGSMRELAPRHRAVLTMRCYDNMSYSEIAKSIGCTELGARALFYRAKKALAKRLSEYGLGKGSLLLALALFGKMTATSEAAAAQVSVTAATTKVGVTAALVAMCSGKAAVIALTTAGILAIGGIAAKPGLDKMFAASPNLKFETSNSKLSCEEYWYYYPSGVNGPLMMRLMKGNSRGEDLYCQCMQDETGNYYYDKAKFTVYVKNHRLLQRDLSVWRLPTDSAELREFLSEVEGRGEEMEYVSSNRDGLMVVARLQGSNGHLWTTHHYHVLKEEYFRDNWPAGVKLVDNRDAMHERGWTYFRITGQLNGETVSGTGRIPFVYAASKLRYAWLKLRVGDRLRIVDNGTEACVYDATGKTATRYRGGSFFQGLCRPWMGLHTVDTVRRDAARVKVRFETRYSADQTKAEIVLTCEQTKLTYDVDMERDVIEKITFLTNDNTEGELKFSYLQEMGRDTGEFAAPRQVGSPRQLQDSTGMLWLVKLAEGKLASEK